jgi:hypothetical protein
VDTVLPGAVGTQPPRMSPCSRKPDMSCGGSAGSEAGHGAVCARSSQASALASSLVRTISEL